jgi:hypothetical protein
MRRASWSIPEIIEQVRRAWGLPLRDSYGQTDHHDDRQFARTADVPGSMGALPGYRVALIDAEGLESDTGEIAIPLRPRTVGLMSGYQNEHGQLMPIEGEYYKTGDVASRDADGAITFIGRADDVFKSSDYRLSPFELESVLIEPPAIAEAAVVPALIPCATIAKGYVALPKVAPRIARRRRRSSHMRGRLSSYKPAVRRIEFFELPKTVSGKIRRVELRMRKARSPSAANARKRNSGSRIFRRRNENGPAARGEAAGYKEVGVHSLSHGRGVGVRGSREAPRLTRASSSGRLASATFSRKETGRSGVNLVAIHSQTGRQPNLHRSQRAVAFRGRHAFCSARRIFPVAGIVIDGRRSGAARSSRQAQSFLPAMAMP